MTSKVIHTISLTVHIQVEVMSSIGHSANSFLLAEAMGNAQHHDGVSGTERQAVVEDYARSVYHDCLKSISLAISNIYFSVSLFHLLTQFNSSFILSLF